MPFLRYIAGELVSDEELNSPSREGAGTELKKLLALIGIHETPGCACRAVAWKMDRNGPDWCAANIPQISETMEKEARKRGIPFVRTIVESLIKCAIWKARRKLAKVARK